MRDSWRTRVEMHAADALSAMSLMSAGAVATPGVMIFIGASLGPCSTRDLQPLRTECRDSREDGNGGTWIGGDRAGARVANWRSSSGRHQARQRRITMAIAMAAIPSRRPA